MVQMTNADNKHIKRHVQIASNYLLSTNNRRIGGVSDLHVPTALIGTLTCVRTGLQELEPRVLGADVCVRVISDEGVDVCVGDDGVAGGRDVRTHRWEVALGLCVGCVFGGVFDCASACVFA
jgi:hypothetical protein